MYKTEMIRKFMEKGVPFNEFMGFEIVEFGEGEARMRVAVRPEFTGDPFRPALHGGLISALADTGGGVAVLTCLEEGQMASTVDLRVDYLRPGRVDSDLWAHSRVLRVGNRVAATHTTVYQSDPEKPVATASAVYNVVRLKNGAGLEPGDE